MDIKEKNLLKQQLEQQAKQLISEQNDTALIGALLATSAALLGAVERTMSDDMQAREFDRICAGYLGLSARVDRFFHKSADRLGEYRSRIDEGKLRKDQAVQALLDIKKELGECEADASAAEKNAREAQERLDALLALSIREKEHLKRCEAEYRDLQEALRQTKTDIQRLETEITEANEERLELHAHYAEFERICAAIREEGYVDMDSFLKALDQMNRESQALRKEYDTLLSRVVADVESMQNKIKQSTGIHQ